MGKKGKSIDTNLEDKEEIFYEHNHCSGKLKQVKHKFRGCSEKFYKCIDCRQIFVEVKDKYCSAPVYITFDI